MAIAVIIKYGVSLLCMMSVEKLVAERSNVRINHYHANLPEITTGIVFLYASWSHSFIQLKNLLRSLETYPDILLFIFDVDEVGSFDFFTKNGFPSHGWGETYWIKEALIIAAMRKYTEKQQEQLLDNHRQLI